MLYGLYEKFIGELIQFYCLLSTLTSTGRTCGDEDNVILGFFKYHLYGISDDHVIKLDD